MTHPFSASGSHVRPTDAIIMSAARFRSLARFRLAARLSALCERGADIDSPAEDSVSDASVAASPSASKASHMASLGAASSFPEEPNIIPT
eukprot:CAMPEP_0170145102 /NCGR_PEP_ID=MMETSP0033_2-20121228/16338_1 /TAXON_ID=195969 /ORGANISM="Dolichomastix tenuilepis, Strain CCMP3274" /LENGTH=90 /DNA_ID=CAMNT_0010381637 /DNA_START=247 /DNA_END=519 /DNA_ORIENTATION=-